MDAPSDQPPRTPNAGRASNSPEQHPNIRDFGLAIEHDGTWLYQGSPIRRPELVKLFASVLRREDDGHYWLVTPVERGRIAVADVPFVAVELSATGEGQRQQLRLRTNLDEWVTVSAAHPLRVRRRVAPAADPGPVPYVEVRPGLEARLTRPVYYELVDCGTWQDGGGERFGVWSDGRFFLLEGDDAG